MTVEPTAHPSPVPLELVDGFATLVALPSQGSDVLRSAITPYAAEALAFSVVLQATEAVVGVAVGFLFLVAEGVGFGALRRQAEEEERRSRPPAPVDTLAGP